MLTTSKVEAPDRPIKMVSQNLNGNNLHIKQPRTCDETGILFSQTVGSACLGELAGDVNVPGRKAWASSLWFCIRKCGMPTKWLVQVTSIGEL